ncbi:MAG TPA: Re/Si-specific NAD(P)(+) transhydrogenase subunit alpha [Dongiaceae bacterium]|jgi:NAD(P) transhydrogenase subunit alpha|nr:Re/Si-specific NAD(P)(+) transhydrogenase subunit alpha [Dongiaceae bacterium]
MIIGIVRERRLFEKRVAATPDTVKKLRGLGAELHIERGAGIAASIPDAAFEAAGAVLGEHGAILARSDFLLKVQRPLLNGEEDMDELIAMKPGATLIGMLNPHGARDSVIRYAQRGVDAFAMELMPRITRAQVMDVLSSQSNLAGYRAVIDACAVFHRAFPMMMTAAGTVAPARVLVMGAGVAGLQAIATARRLGAIVSATDVRPAAKEQVESLGANFVAVEDEEFKQAENAGGYAKEMSPEYQRKQAALIAETIRKQDIVITTALIPGRPAPILVDEDMVRNMKPGSVIVDLAVEQGGNCPLSELGKIVDHHHVSIVGYANWPSRIPYDASHLYARNLLAFVQLLIDKQDGAKKIDWNDEIVAATGLTREGAIVHPAFGGNHA